jgi:hypothetical protein
MVSRLTASLPGETRGNRDAIRRTYLGEGGRADSIPWGDVRSASATV